MQSQGHRRRRRRRKNKSGHAAPQAQPAQGQQPPQSQAPAQNQPQGPRRQPQQRPQHQHQGRKKKFFQKNQSQQGPPGNNVNGGQGKRKGRQKGPRAFVGPMDHSYRVANGNVADGPPSTIPTSGNGHGGGYYPDIYAGQSAAPVRQDAPTRIYCFIEDLFFLAKIQETARKIGVKVEFVKGDKEAVDRILDAPEDARPALLVFDLN
ncbi:MAG: response regulator, partial [Terracidiphilus sp.]